MSTNDAGCYDIPETLTESELLTVYTLLMHRVFELDQKCRDNARFREGVERMRALRDKVSRMRKELLPKEEEEEG